MCACLTNVMAFCVNAGAGKRLLNYGLWRQLWDVLPNLLLSLVMAVPVALLGRLPLPDILLLPAQILTGGAVYVGLSLITRNESFRFVLKLVIQKLSGSKE